MAKKVAFEQKSEEREQLGYWLSADEWAGPRPGGAQLRESGQRLEQRLREKPCRAGKGPEGAWRDRGSCWKT